MLYIHSYNRYLGRPGGAYKNNVIVLSVVL